MHLSFLLGLSYLVSEIALAVFRRSQSSGESTSLDRNSLRLLWLAIGLSIWLALQVSARWPAGALPHPRACAIIGLLIFIAGITLRWWSIVQLGRFFTVDVSIAQDHEVIDSGPYRFVRHPSYTGALLAFLGFGLSLGNWLAIVALLVPIFAAFLYRIQVEEGALIGALGEKYLAYARRTKRLVPFLY